MKIVMICPFYGKGLLYQENVVAHHYERRGHQVTIFTSLFESVFDVEHHKYDVAGAAHVLHDGAVKIVRLPYSVNILRRLRAFKGLARLLENEEPELIYFHDTMLDLSVATRYVRRHLTTKLILDFHADYSNSGRNWISLHILHGVIRRFILWRARPYLQRIFPVTPATAEFLHEIYGVPHSEMEVLPLGTDMDLVRATQASGSGETIRSKYGISPDARVIFTGGKLGPSKHFELLIEAFRQLHHPDRWLIVAGDSGKDDVEYKSMLHAAAKSDPRIVFTGWLEPKALFAHLDASDLAVFPGNQSVIWQHAIGLGKPLVLADPRASAGETQDASYLGPYGNIIVTDEKFVSTNWMTKTIDALLTDQERLVRMAAGARRAAAELLDWDTIAERTLRYNAERPKVQERTPE